MRSRTDRHALGKAAEDAAARFLKTHGYTLLARNFSTRLGEIDIIAADGETLCFVEVKARTGGENTPPYVAVDRRKQARLRAAAARYLAARRLHSPLCRFDVVWMTPTPDAATGWKIELLRDAF